MINASVYCNEHSSLNAIYKFENFLENDYLQKIVKKTEKLTEKDSLNRKTIVKANVTNFNELLKHNEYKEFIEKVIQQLELIIRLRANNKESWEYLITDFWGMRHKKGDVSLRHNHLASHWSGSFYLKVPGETFIFFPEFNYKDLIKENVLYLFSSLTDHYTSIQEYAGNRISVAFNILMKRN